MKKFLKAFVLAICLMLPTTFCLTACGGETEEIKVVSISVESVSGSFYTLVDGEIDIEYGERVTISDVDFVVTAITNDGNTKTIAIKSDGNGDGFTFSSNIPNDDITPIGEYTLTFGHENLLEADYKTIGINVVKKVVDVNSLDLIWSDDENDIAYNGQAHTVKITNLPEYLETTYYNNVETVPGNYYAVASIKVKDEYADRYTVKNDEVAVSHKWTIKKGTIEIPNISYVTENYTYDGGLKVAKLTDESKEQLADKNISATLSGSTSGINAGEYQVTISFKYTGEDKTYYDLGDEYLIGTRETTWKIYPKEIDLSSVELKVKGGETYSKAFTYDGNEKSVVFDLSSLSFEGYTGDSTYPIEKGLPSTGTQILELIEPTGSFSATNVGEYTVSITFRISSIFDYRKNYKFKDTEDTEVDIIRTWKIDKQIISTYDIGLRTNGTNYTDTSLTYNGKEQQVFFDMSDLNYLGFYTLSEDSILSYTETGTKGTNAVIYTATITFTVNDGNYAVSDATVTRQWKINKKELSVIAEMDKSFTYGVTMEEIISGVKLAPLGYPGIEDFVDGEGEGDGENGSVLYNTLYDAITFRIGVSDYDSNTYTGKLNVGTYFLYPVVPEGLTLKNYEIKSNTCVSMIIKKANLTLTVKDKTNEDDDYNPNKYFALTYDGNAKAYTSNDVIATGLVNGDTPKDLGITFEYAKRDFKVQDSILSFTDSEPTVWTATAPTDAGAYQVRVVFGSGNYNITQNAGKMLIMKKGVKITIDDLTLTYGVKVSELNPTNTLGGDLHYHVGGNFYQYLSMFDAESMIGYKVSNDTDEAVESILAELKITLAGKYSFGNYVGDEETFVDVFEPWSLENEDVVGVGTYKITFNQDLLSELNSATNYEFVVVDGTLTIDSAA